MRFIAEILHNDEPGDHLIEFGFEDIGHVDAPCDVMYVKGVPVLISSVVVVEDDEKQLVETVQSTASSIALSMLNETLENGGTVEIPSLGIVIKK